MDEPITACEVSTLDYVSDSHITSHHTSDGRRTSHYAVYFKKTTILDFKKYNSSRVNFKKSGENGPKKSVKIWNAISTKSKILNKLDITDTELQTPSENIVARETS